MVRVLIPVAVVVFLLVSAGIARALSAASAERGAIGEIVRVEAKGDAAGVIARLEGCDPACSRLQRRNAARLERRGVIRVLNLEPSTRFALGGLRAKTRVAWVREGGKPVVQCVGVHRTGDVVRGFRLRLTSLSAPIAGESGCGGG